jgi:hypothetical protein
MRTIESTTLANLQAAVVRPAWFLDITLDGTTYYFWNGSNDISWNSHTYLGNGYWQGVVPQEDSRDGADTGLELTFSAVPSTMREPLIDNGNKRGAVLVHHGTLDSENATVSGTPFQLYSGEIDSINLLLSATSMKAAVSCVGKFSRGRKYKELRYTESTQKMFDATDNGFNFVPKLEKFEGSWGSFKPVKKKKKHNEGKR